MTRNRHVPLVLVLLAGLALAGCGRSAKEEMAGDYCPNPLTVSDAEQLTRFKPGLGRDPRDIVFEAFLGGAGTACAIKRNSLEVDLTLRVAVNAGPAAPAGVTHVPYFVRILNGSGQVVQGQDFNADFKLSQASPRGSSLEKLTLNLPFNRISDIGGYRVAVGLMPTEQELEYNRRSAAR